METNKCAVCGQACEDEKLISLEYIQGYLAYQLAKAACAALETSNEPAVLEQAHLALEAISSM